MKSERKRIFKITLEQNDGNTVRYIGFQCPSCMIDWLNQSDELYSIWNRADIEKLTIKPIDAWFFDSCVSVVGEVVGEGEGKSQDLAPSEYEPPKAEKPFENEPEINKYR